MSDIVFVYEGLAVREVPGCGAINAIDTSSGDVVFRGPYHPGHGQMAISPDGKRVVAGWSQGGLGTIYSVDLEGESPEAWRARVVDSANGTTRAKTKSGIAFSSDGTRLIISEDIGPDAGVVWHPVEDLAKDRFSVSEDAFWIRNDRAGDIISNPESKLVHVITYDGLLYSLNQADLAARESVVVLPPVVADHTDPNLSWRGHRIHAALAPHKRFLVANQWNTNHLTNVDLKYGTAESMTLPEEFETTGGVAFNHGWNNPGLLAAHHGDMIAVYEYDPYSSLVHELARIEIEPPTDGFEEQEWPAFVGWSASGDKLVAGTNDGESDFAVLDVLGCGTEIRLSRLVTTCAADGHRNTPMDIVSLNGIISPPPDAVQACATPWWMPEATPEAAGPTETLHVEGTTAHLAHLPFLASP